MGDRWGTAGPPEEAYSRITRDLSTVYAGLPAAVEARLGRLVSTYDATVSHVDPSSLPRDDDGPPPAVDAITVQPADPDALPLRLVVTGDPVVWVWTTGPRWFALPVCGCDACDADLGDVMDQLEQVVDDVTSGPTLSVSGLRRLRVDRRTAWSASSEWFDRDEARRLGLRRGTRSWSAWPLRRKGT